MTPADTTLVRPIEPHPLLAPVVLSRPHRGSARRSARTAAQTYDPLSYLKDTFTLAR